MSDLAYLLFGNLAPAALGYLVICWKDACSAPVEIADEVGLCAGCREGLRRDVPAGSS